MADLNGMWNLPKKGLSTVANPGNGQWSMIIDTENADAVTVILGGAVSYTTVVLSAPGEVLITPPVLGADQISYSPTGWDGANRARLAASLAVAIRGFAASTTPKDVFNSAAFVITLKHEDPLETTPANRIHIPGGVDLPLNQDDSVSLWYDAVLTRWRLV
jgi:hypothetical protein